MCGCDRHSLASQEPPPRGDVCYSVVDELPPGCHKACSEPSTGKIWVDRNHFDGWGDAEKDFALAHETAHNSGAQCESCADFVAGAIMRRWGWSQTISARAARGVVTGRPISEHQVKAGWIAASRPAYSSLDTKTRARSVNRPVRYATKPATKPSGRFRLLTNATAETPIKTNATAETPVKTSAPTNAAAETQVDASAPTNATAGKTDTPILLWLAVGGVALYLLSR
jgi:hypothetical protein